MNFSKFWLLIQSPVILVMGALMSDKVPLVSSKYDLYSTFVIAMLYSVHVGLLSLKNWGQY